MYGKIVYTLHYVRAWKRAYDPFLKRQIRKKYKDTPTNVSNELTPLDGRGRASSSWSRPAVKTLNPLSRPPVTEHKPGGHRPVFRKILRIEAEAKNRRPPNHEKRSHL